MAMLPCPLAHGEDARLAYGLQVIVRNSTEPLNWAQWLHSFEERVADKEGDALRKVNAGHFLKALYLMVLWEYPSWIFIDQLAAEIKSLDGFYEYGILPLTPL